MLGMPAVLEVSFCHKARSVLTAREGAASDRGGLNAIVGVLGWSGTEGK